MDTELFQWLAIGLLAAIAVLLGLVSVSLRGIRRALDQSAASASGLEADGGARPAETAAAVEAERAVAADTIAVRMEEEEERSERETAEATSARAAEPAPHETEAAAGAEEEPQEQPFERDGRWWFRRGDELLVYDEGTGEWQQAPGSRPRSTSSSAEATQGQSAVATETRTSTERERRAEDLSGASQESASAFWKCPACGAVNGSSASSCRMCFTARP